jgi:hypothetical protein
LRFGNPPRNQSGRSTQGVFVFDTAEDKHAVSVEHIGEDTEHGNGGSGMIRESGNRFPKRSR